MYELWSHNPESGRSRATFSSAQSIPWTMDVYYREQGPKAVRFATGLQVVRREFFAKYDGGGLGYGSGKAVDVRLDMLYWNLQPEICVNERGSLVFRLGPQFGWLLRGTMEGRSSTWSQGSPGSGPPSSITSELQRRYTSDFKGDIRFLFGFGFRLPLGERTALTIDPYWSTALTSMLDPEVASISMRGYDAGVMVGMSWQHRGRGLWPGRRAGASNGTKEP